MAIPNFLIYKWQEARAFYMIVAVFSVLLPAKMLQNQPWNNQINQPAILVWLIRHPAQQKLSCKPHLQHHIARLLLPDARRPGVKIIIHLQYIM